MPEQSNYTTDEMSGQWNLIFWQLIYFCIILFLRPTGDTIDRLSTLHELLAEAADWPRVVQCAQIVPVLLHVFFNAVIKVRG